MRSSTVERSDESDESDEPIDSPLGSEEVSSSAGGMAGGEIVATLGDAGVSFGSPSNVRGASESTTSIGTAAEAEDNSEPVDRATSMDDSFGNDSPAAGATSVMMASIDSVAAGGAGACSGVIAAAAECAGRDGSGEVDACVAAAVLFEPSFT